MKTFRAVAPLVAVTLLAACGGQTELRQKQGQPLPPRAAGVTRDKTPTEMLKPTPQQRPSRTDELLRQSQERADDPFSLPPE